MNKQQKKHKDGTTGRGIEWTDYTWNPVRGCFHACEWDINGQRANCYAEDIANKMAAAAYPDGFEHHYFDPSQLTAPMNVRTPARIFTGSMADLFGHWVPDEHIAAVLGVARVAEWHTFQLLTKNPVRANNFDLPPNVWVGASSPPDYMWNKALTDNQKRRMFERFMKSLAATNARVRWMSAEPLSWDIAPLLREYAGTLQWIVIGAASSGKRYYPPNIDHYRAAIDELDKQGVPVFLKGNMKCLPFAAQNWREQYPGDAVTPQPVIETLQQTTMF